MSAPAHLECFTTDCKGKQRYRCQGLVLRSWWERKAGEGPMTQCRAKANYEDYEGRHVCGHHHPEKLERRRLRRGLDPEETERRKQERIAAARRRAPIEDEIFLNHEYWRRGKVAIVIS